MYNIMYYVIEIAGLNVVIAGIIISIIILLVVIVVILIVVIILIYKSQYYIVVTITTVCMCVLLVSSTKQSKDPVMIEFRNDAYGIHQSSIKVTENISYSTVEQQSSLITPPVYETIYQDSTDVYDNINDYI